MWIAVALLTNLCGHLWRWTFGLRWFSLRCSRKLCFVFNRRFWFQAGRKIGRQSHLARFVVVFIRGRYLGLPIGLRGRYGFGGLLRCRARFGWLRLRLGLFHRLLQASDLLFLRLIQGLDICAPVLGE